MVGYLYPRAMPPVTQSSAFQAPKRIEVLYDATSLLTGHMPHMALRCLEGSTLSNLVHRRRRCARIVLHSILCLEGSTPEDRSGADTQAAPVGRCMCGIPYPGCRFALPWVKCLLPFQGAYLGRTMRGQETLHQAKVIVVAPGEPIFYCQRQLFCFLGA